jgi:hypothetical protein
MGATTSRVGRTEAQQSRTEWSAVAFGATQDSPETAKADHPVQIARRQPDAVSNRGIELTARR